jgi:hypothetical protein
MTEGWEAATRSSSKATTAECFSTTTSTSTKPRPLR